MSVLDRFVHGPKYRVIQDGDSFRIVALLDIPRHDVRAGDVGGQIVSYLNLSQSGDAWIEAGAKVEEEGYVHGNALVGGRAKICASEVCGNARVVGDAKVWNYSKVEGQALVGGNAKVCNTVVQERGVVRGDALTVNSIIGGNAVIEGTAVVENSAEIYAGHFSSGVFDTPGPIEQAREKAREDRLARSVLVDDPLGEGKYDRDHSRPSMGGDYD